MIKCSKCGTECSDKALFCSSCGKSLADERGDNKTYKCSKCGATFKGKKAFCENCGTKFVWQDKPEEVKEEVKQTSVVAEAQKQSTATKVMNIITYSISFVVIILSMIAVWLNFSDFNIASEIGFKFDFGVNVFFKDMWEEEALTVTYLPAFVMFIIAVILTYVFGIIALVKQIKSGIKKEFRTSLTSLAYATIPTFSYQVLAYSVICIKEKIGNVGIETTLGPGLILTVLAMSILLVLAITHNIFNKIKTPNQIVSSIFKYIVAFIFVFVGIFAFTHTRVMANTYGDASTNINLLVATEWNSIKHSTDLWTEMIIEMVIQAAAVIAIIATALYSFIGINKKEYNGTKITLSAISLALMIGFIICFLVSKNDFKAVSTTEFELGSRFIIGLVLSVIGFGLSIASAALDSKQEA